MRIAVVLNRESGTLRSVDVEEYCSFLKETCAMHGHEAEPVPVPGKQLASSIKKAFSDEGIDAVFAAGGDGTISAAAHLAWKTQKPLGVIPAGTMNLFARVLGIPLDIREAARVLAAGTPQKVDIATANERPFLLQYTVGFHPRMVRQRDKAEFSSRLGKIRATVFAALDAIRQPPVFPAEITADGKTGRMTLSSIAVSNNPYGDLPFSDDPTGGRLAIYLAEPADAATNAKMLADLTFGTWRDNPDIREMQAGEVTLRFPARHRRAKAAIDGELVELADTVEFRIHPGELPVIRPNSTGE